MTSLRSLAIAGVLAITAIPVLAQTAPAPVAPAKDMPMDCAMSSMKRHDHGIERGAGPAAASMPCERQAAASQPAAAPKKVLRHDHARFHKNQ